jgi:hypothetical protein
MSQHGITTQNNNIGICSVFVNFNKQGGVEGYLISRQTFQKSTKVTINVPQGFINKYY